MAKTEIKSKTKPKESVAPIKVEKINMDDNSKKEVLAIIIGILVIAALITGSVIYFRSDGEDLTKPNKKPDNIVDVKPNNKPGKKKHDSEYGGNGSYRLIPVKASTKSSIDEEEDDEDDEEEVYVKKACTSNCTRIDVNAKTSKAKGNSAKGKTNKEYFVNNNITTTYVATSETSFNVNVSGNLATTANDLKILAKASVQLATDKAVKDEINNRKTVAAKTSGNVKLTDKNYAADAGNNTTVRNKLETAVDNEVAKKLEELSTVDDTDGLIAVMANENDKVATYAFNVRIDETNKIDWEHGVTVKVTYNKGDALNEKSVTKKYKKDANANYSYQDENGINIVVMADADDFNTKAQIDAGTAVNKKIDLDVDYYTLEGANVYNGGAGEEKETTYTVDMTNVYVKEDDLTAEELTAGAIAANEDYKKAKKLTDADTTPGVVDTVIEQVEKNADELENKVMTQVTSDAPGNNMVAEIKGVADTDMSAIDEEITGVIEDTDYTGANTMDSDTLFETVVAP